MKVPKHLSLILKVLVSIVLLFILIKTQDFNKVFSYLKSYNPIYLSLALTLLLLGTLVSSFRLKTILQSSSTTKNVPTNFLFNIYLKGYFYNNFLPTQMGGDLYKALALSKKTNEKSLSFFAVFIDRFGGLIVLLVMALLGISITYGILWFFLAVLVMVIGFTLYFPILKVLSKKLTIFKKFYEASLFFIQSKKYGLRVILLSFFVQVLSFSSVYVLFMGFNIYLPLWLVVAYMPLASLSLLIPSYNGLGTQELVYAAIFSSVVTPETSIAVSFLVHIVRLVMSLMGGLQILYSNFK